jgi:hypothetical protein
MKQDMIVMAQNIHDGNSLFDAASSGNLETIKYLVENGAM